MDDLMTISALVHSGSWLLQRPWEAHQLDMAVFQASKFQVLAGKSAGVILLLPRRYGHSSFNGCSVRSPAKTLNDHTGDWLAVTAVAGGSGHKKECQSDSKPGL